jgi:hypothetical protein
VKNPLTEALGRLCNARGGLDAIEAILVKFATVARPARGHAEDLSDRRGTS